MTEEDAKTNWCPFARVLTQHHGREIEHLSGWNRRDASSFGRGDTIDDASLCIGSACMAWRWYREPVKGRVMEGLAQGPVTVGAVAGEGYCGLVGKP